MDLRIAPEVLSRPIEEYRAAWSALELLTTDDFLQPADASGVTDFLEMIPDSDWAVSVHPYANVYTFANSSENQQTISDAIKSASEAYSRGAFAYHFKRHEPAGNELFDFSHFLMSKACLSLLSSVTGLDLTTSVSVFFSCYGSGCFLSTHTDTGRGKLAFVYNATRSWNDSDGGQFQLLSPDWSSVLATVRPRYNSLTFFRVEGQGVPHRVLPVAPTATARRLAISGWLV